MKKQEVHKAVRERYAGIAKQNTSCGCGGTQKAAQSACCSGSSQVASIVSKNIGYSDQEINAVPEGANMGLGCGNPVALASLKPGEVVLDLGSGGGFDCFLASDRVGETGKVIGVDMTPEMLDKSRENARKGKYKNVEFRLGEIENLPVADNSVDAIISNCVINLSVDKKRVFSEAFRVLKPSGRMMVSDIVLLKALPDAIKQSVEAYAGCIAGALKKADYLKAIKSAGFQDVKIVDEVVFPLEAVADDTDVKEIVEQLEITEAEIKELASSIVSIKVSATKT